MRKFKRIEVPVSDEEIIKLNWLSKQNDRSIETVMHGIIVEYLNKMDMSYIPKYESESHKAALSAVAQAYYITVDQMMNRDRQRTYAEARHMFFYILRNKYLMKYESIGRLSKFNYATIIHAVKNIDNLLSYDAGVIYRYNQAMSYLE